MQLLAYDLSYITISNRSNHYSLLRNSSTLYEPQFFPCFLQLRLYNSFASLGGLACLRGQRHFSLILLIYLFDQIQGEFHQPWVQVDLFLRIFRIGLSFTSPIEKKKTYNQLCNKWHNHQKCEKRETIPALILQGLRKLSLGLLGGGRRSRCEIHVGENSYVVRFTAGCCCHCK